MEREFTATVYIILEKKVLLHKHEKLQKWLPPGGHLERNETPPEAARREVKEETGLDIEFIKQENVWVNEKNASSIERPYMCLLEHIPAHKERPFHQHIDFIFLARPLSNNIPAGFQWFSLEEVEKMRDIYEETKQTIRHIL